MNSTHRQIATTHQVTKEISRIAENILQDYSSNTPLFVALLRGAAPFAAKLITEIAKQNPNYHPEIDYMMVRTYGDSQHAGTPQIITDIAPGTEIKGRDVIIIDDVLDKGITADFVAKHLSKRGAQSIKLAVLCDKKTNRTLDVAADYIGFEFGDKWLVGMGMDDATVATEGYRWIEEIWEVR